ncbi:TPA: hypothetical protein QEL15_002058 [Stenotrophomonas maltophilia]|nr:hypothetical protein [Stenotrophomonas maltophilia]
MKQTKIDQSTRLPNGDVGDDAFTAFAKINDNIDLVDSRLDASGSDLEALQLGIQQERLARQQGDASEAQTRQQAIALLSQRVDGLGSRVLGDNVLLNGDFDIWQRGTAFATTAVYGPDRWFIQQGGVAGQSFARNPLSPGDANFPGSESNLFVTLSGNSSSSSAHQVFEQRVEDCRTFADMPSTLSFRVFNPGPAGRRIAVEFAQTFGVGGSATVLGIAPQVFTLASGLNIITKTITLPSIAGKTVGAGSAAVAAIWTTAGSDFSVRTAGLGLQTGSLYFGKMKWEAGVLATPFVRRPSGAELMLCYRYGEPVGLISDSQGAYYTAYYYKVTKRGVPTLVLMGSSIAPAVLNARGSTTWFSVDGRAPTSVASYCFADAEI